jgi:manganese/zinc/iron transport system permease protein
MGDAMAHAALPGVCLAFMLTGQKHPLYFFVGALVAGLLGAQVIQWLTQNSRIKSDTAVGLVLSVFFGIGVLLLTVIQQGQSGNQSGLDSFLFGKAAFLLKSDVYLLASMCVVLLLLVSLFFKEFKLISFDLGFASSIGLPVRLLEQFLTALIVVAVMVGLQVVGVILMAALLIIPAAAARQWTDRLGIMCVIAAGVGAFAGMLGAFVSALWSGMPTGPVMVLSAGSLFAISLMFAPRRGLLPAWWKKRRAKRKVQAENLLRKFYKAGEKAGQERTTVSVASLTQWSEWSHRQLSAHCRRLARMGWLESIDNAWRLSELGHREAARITRNHRLWELYLTSRLDIAADHVHRDADEMEHLLTPEIIAQLEARLGQPQRDPHGHPIPPTPYNSTTANILDHAGGAK